MATAPAARDEGLPALSEEIDSDRGSVRVRGHLTVQGADLLRGTVESLRRNGHDRVLLDLGDVHDVDSAGLHDLRDLERSMAEEGDELLVVAAPTIPRPRT